MQLADIVSDNAGFLFHRGDERRYSRKLPAADLTAAGRMAYTAPLQYVIFSAL